MFLISLTRSLFGLRSPCPLCELNHGPVSNSDKNVIELILVDSSTTLDSLGASASQVAIWITTDLKVEHDLCQDQAHLEVCQVLADAAPGPGREGHEGALGQGDDALGRGTRRVILINDPALGPEPERLREVFRVVVHAVRGRAHLDALGDVLAVHDDAAPLHLPG